MQLSLEDRTVNEGKNFFYRTTLTDEFDAPIPLSSIVSATLTLYDTETLEIINGRNDQDVLNANDVQIDVTSGVLDWEMQPEDNILLTPISAGELESHVALFTITYDTDNVITHEREILVRQVAKIPPTP